MIRTRAARRLPPCVLVAVLGLVACGGEQEPSSRALYELERLAFVPAAPCRLFGFVGPLADCGIDEALLVDRFELTRRDWLHYDPEGARQSAARFSDRIARLDGECLEWPAFVSQRQARTLARRRGMRLLEASEWVHVAVGRRSLVYPYGHVLQESWANTLELGLGRPAAVGTFETGRSQPFGCYDMLGNVWEWVSDEVPGYSELSGDEPWPELALDDVASVLGGAYDSRSRRTFGRWPLRFHAMRLDRDTVTPSVGVRMAAPAREYLWEHADDWGAGPAVRERVRAVGRLWAVASGREPVLGLVRELAAREGAPGALTWLAEGAAAPER